MSKHLGEWEIAHLDLLDKLQGVKSAGDEEGVRHLLSPFADCELLEFTNELEALQSKRLEEYERDFVLDWLRKGAGKVWVATDFMGWEH